MIDIFKIENQSILRVNEGNNCFIDGRCYNNNE